MSEGEEEEDDEGEEDDGDGEEGAAERGGEGEREATAAAKSANVAGVPSTPSAPHHGSAAGATAVPPHTSSSDALDGAGFSPLPPRGLARPSLTAASTFLSSKLASPAATTAEAPTAAARSGSTSACDPTLTSRSLPSSLSLERVSETAERRKRARKGPDFPERYSEGSKTKTGSRGLLGRAPFPFPFSPPPPLLLPPFAFSALLLHLAKAASRAGLSWSLRSERSQSTTAPEGPEAPIAGPRLPGARAAGEGAGTGTSAPAGRRDEGRSEEEAADFALEGLGMDLARERNLEKADAGLEGRRAPFAGGERSRAGKDEGGTERGDGESRSLPFRSIAPPLPEIDNECLSALPFFRANRRPDFFRFSENSPGLRARGCASVAAREGGVILVGNEQREGSQKTVRRRGWEGERIASESEF